MRKIHLKYLIPDQAEESKAVGKVFKAIVELKEKNYSFSVQEKYLILNIKFNDIPQDLISAIADLPFNTMNELSLEEEDENAEKNDDVKISTSASEGTVSDDEAGESKEDKEKEKTRSLDETKTSSIISADGEYKDYKSEDEEDNDYSILSKDIINLVQEDPSYFLISKVGVILDQISTEKNVEFYNSHRSKFLLLVEAVVREVAEGKNFIFSFEDNLIDYFGGDAHIAKEYLYQSIEDYCERRGIQIEIEKEYSAFFDELISLMYRLKVL